MSSESATREDTGTVLHGHIHGAPDTAEAVVQGL